MSSVTFASRMRRAMLVLAAVTVLVVIRAFSADPAIADPVITHAAEPAITQPVEQPVIPPEQLILSDPIFNPDLGGLADFDMAPPLVPADAAAHVVQPEETLSGIAANLGTITEDLRAANDLPNPDLIFPGQVLRH